MPQLHARGVDLVVDLLDTADYVDRITPEETKALLKEAAMVLGEILKRDVPEGRRKGDDLQTFKKKAGSAGLELGGRR